MGRYHQPKSGRKTLSQIYTERALAHNGAVLTLSEPPVPERRWGQEFRQFLSRNWDFNPPGSTQSYQIFGNKLSFERKHENKACMQTTLTWPMLFIFRLCRLWLNFDGSTQRFGKNKVITLHETEERGRWSAPMRMSVLDPWAKICWATQDPKRFGQRHLKIQNPIWDEEKQHFGFHVWDRKPSCLPPRPVSPWTRLADASALWHQAPTLRSTTSNAKTWSKTCFVERERSPLA